MPTQKDMETAIGSYVAQGYVVGNKTETSAMLVKKKQFSIPIAIVGFLVCVIGLVIYLIVYAFQFDQVIEISVVATNSPPRI